MMSPRDRAWPFPQVFLASLVLSVLLLLPEIMTYRLSTDNEYGAFRDSAWVWAAQGRWAAYLVETFVFTQPVVPAFGLVAFAAGLSAATLVYLRQVHRWIGSVRAVLITVGFVTFTQWMFVAEFMVNLLPAVFAAPAVLIAASACRRTLVLPGPGGVDRRRFVLLQLAVVGLVAFATGVYQTFLAGYVVLAGFAVAAIALRSGRLHLRAGVTALALAIGQLVLAVLVYGGMARATRAVLDLEPFYVHELVRLDTLWDTPVVVALRVLTHYRDFLTGDPAVYGHLHIGVPVVLLTVLVGLGLRAVRRLTSPRIVVLQTLAVLALSVVPFVILFGVAGIGSYRMMVGLPYFILIMLILLAGTARGYGRRLQRAMLPIVGVILLTGNAYTISVLAASDINVRTFDEYFTLRLGLDIIEAGPAEGRIVVDIQGNPNYRNHFPVPHSSTTGVSAFDWGEGHRGRFNVLFRMHGFHRLQAAPEPVHRSNRAFAATLPIWPRDGSMVMRDGVLIVHLGRGPRPRR